MKKRLEKYCREVYGAKYIVGKPRLMQTDRRDMYMVEVFYDGPNAHTAFLYIPADKIK